ncbi:DUF4388 domain-containing protein [Methylacidimicrobium tartarophylax]|uniref:Uncharacterized protein n=1 Tax=Methylacidimicrobium tartarophylax TaxID=1041768 RepID=A0A5E6M8Y9_9BACT|nr:DUF4388 domain-containing protein [Methylacidimicrobium tartarophylax]VVM04777.1 hypothetical protein MAMT_00292 [Methylacidimicrobium tartarophylax]
MPLSGDLSELPFPEILRLLRDRNGKLQITDKATGERFSFSLSAGKLVSASEADGPIPDTLALHSAIQRLSTNERASFVFQEGSAGMGEPLGGLSIPLDQILLSSLAAIRSPERVAAHLPHPGTRFRAAEQTTPWLTEDLLAFWVSAERFLRSGVCASDIVATLGIPLPHVQLELFKLRVLGVIVPLHAPSHTVSPAPPGDAPPLPQLPPSPPAPSAPEPTAAPPPEPVVAPEAALPPIPPSSAPVPSPTALATQVQKTVQPRRGVLARIAAGLRGILEKMYE